jgi:hypothetical protein
MALFIQHGALRNAEDYFCSFKKLMLQQNYRNFDDVLIIAPDVRDSPFSLHGCEWCCTAVLHSWSFFYLWQFNYEKDDLVHPRDAFWNSTKPWGDWRVGAESDPDCCGNKARDTPVTISSFEVLDTMLAMLTNRRLFPKMEKISYVGHSAGAYSPHVVSRFCILQKLSLK